MRAELNTLRQIFLNHAIQMIVMLTEVWEKASVRMIINDFKSFLQDKTHNEWLTEKAVTVIMRTDIVLTDALMINSNVWTAYVINE